MSNVIDLRLRARAEALCESVNFQFIGGAILTCFLIGLLLGLLGQYLLPGQDNLSVYRTQMTHEIHCRIVHSVIGVAFGWVRYFQMFVWGTFSLVYLPSWLGGTLGILLLQ